MAQEGGSPAPPLPFEEPAGETEDVGTDISMMEQAEQMMKQMEQEEPETSSHTADENGAQAEVTGAQRAETVGPYAGALRLSSADKSQRQTSNVFRIIRQQMRANRSLYGKKLADAQRVFALMDADGSGTMTTDEFSDALTRMGLGLTAVQVAEVLAAVDADSSGTVEYNEFVALLGSEFERPASAPAHVPRRRDRSSRQDASTSAGVARSRKVYGNRDALGFEDPPELSDYRHVPVYQSCFPVYVNRVFQKAAPDLATSAHMPQDTTKEEQLLEELRPVPIDSTNSKTLPATMHAQHAIDWGGQIPPARPTSAASIRSAGSRTGRRRPQSAASNLQRRSIAMSKETKVQREVENVFRVISQQLRAKRTLYGEVMAEARDVFNLIDKDRSRTLDKSEFTTALERMGLGLTEDQVEEVIAAIDTDGNGTIEYPEFVALLGAEWSRPRSAPPAKNRFGGSQQSRSAATRRRRSSATRRSRGLRRPGSAPVMDRYSAPQQYPNGWKPRPHRDSKDGVSVQHLPAASDADMSHWGWQDTPGAPGHKTWIDDYKGGVVVEQLTPRRAAWNDQIAREPQHSRRPAVLGWCRDTMTVDSIARPQSAPPRSAAWREQRAREIEAAKASNAHFSRWKPRKATPKKPRAQALPSSEDVEPVQQETEVQTDLLADRQKCPAVVVQVIAAGGFSTNTTGYEVFCKVRFGKHELQTPSLPDHVPHPLPEDPTPLCLFGQPDQALTENFVLFDCFGRAAGESRSIHIGSIRLDLKTPSDFTLQKLRFFKFAQRDEIVREPPTPKTGKLRRHVSYGFGIGSEQPDMGVRESKESTVGEWNEVFADTTGMPPRSTCPEGWLALRVDFTDQAGSTQGTTRKMLEDAVQQIQHEEAKTLGTLSITVCRGRRLPQKQNAEKMLDPICQVGYKDQSAFTSVAFNTRTPVWDETFTFDVTDLNEELRIVVYDWKADSESYDLVGAAALGVLEELDELEESERWVELYVLRSDKTLHRQGDVFCRLAFVPALSTPAGGSARSDLLIGTSSFSVCLQLECMEARGLLIKLGSKICCTVSLHQPLREPHFQTTPAGMCFASDSKNTPIAQERDDNRSECVVTWNSTVDLPLCEPTAVVRVDVAVVPTNSRGRPEALGSFVVPVVHLLPGHKKGEWFQLVDPVELNGSSTNNSASGTFHVGAHTHQAAMYFDNDQPASRARHYEDVKWQAGHRLGLAALKVRASVDRRHIERISATSPKGVAPPGALLDESNVGSLSISVMRATGLAKIRGPRGMKDPDPFVQVLYGSDQYVTSTVRRSRAPCWVDGEQQQQQQQWFTFPVNTTRSIVQFKVYSNSLVGPNTLLGSLSIGLREMTASASKLGTELPDPTDPAVQAEHKLLGVSDDDPHNRKGGKKQRKKLEENGVLKVAMHLQLRSLDGAINLLPATRRLRSVVLTTDFLSTDHRFKIISEDDEHEDMPRKSRPVMQDQSPKRDSFMCIEVTVLECNALRMKNLTGAIRPLVRLRLEDPPRPQFENCDGSDSDDDSPSRPDVLTVERRQWLEKSAEVLMVVLNMQCIRRGKLARRDYQNKRKSLELPSGSQAPCEFACRTFRLHTNKFSQQLVCDVLHDHEPGKVPKSLGSIEIPVDSLMKEAVEGDHWHVLAPPAKDRFQEGMKRIALLLQAHARGKREQEDYQRRCLAPIHVIYLLGGPGSGKTALGVRLAEDLGLIHLSTGEMLRRALRQKENEDLHTRIRVAMAEGVPVPNDVIVPLLRRAVARLRFHRGGGVLLLDGVPISETQRCALEEQVPTDELPLPVQAYHLDCDDETMISRATNRGRDDDGEDVASTMLATFRKSGMPVVEHFEQQGILTRVDTGNSTTEDESYAALKRLLTACMINAGHWSAEGEDPTRAMFQQKSRTRVLHQGEQVPKIPALKLRIRARTTGMAVTGRTIIGVMRWRRAASKRATAKSQAATEGPVAPLPPALQLPTVAEDEETNEPVRGGLTVEV